MLANGAKLAVKLKGATSFSDLPGLKEIPDLGIDPEKVDNTVLTDPHKKYEQGIGDLPDVVYKFKYDNTTTTSSYRRLSSLQKSGDVATFQETLKDGTITTMEAQAAVKRTGGGINGVIDFDLTLIVQSDLTITNPA